MKLRTDLILRQVAGNWIVMPVGRASVDLNGMLTLNESGAFLWDTLAKGATREDLVAALTTQYEVDYARAQADTEEFLRVLTQAGCLQDL